uniref:Ephrin-A4 n=1 Tax=Falco tinnunculus TaxID=100819 RepID=A0A8C4TW37_FALTI
MSAVPGRCRLGLGAPGGRRGAAGVLDGSGAPVPVDVGGTGARLGRGRRSRLTSEVPVPGGLRGTGNQGAGLRRGRRSRSQLMEVPALMPVDVGSPSAGLGRGRRCRCMSPVPGHQAGSGVSVPVPVPDWGGAAGACRHSGVPGGLGGAGAGVPGGLGVTGAGPGAGLGRGRRSWCRCLSPVPGCRAGSAVPMPVPGCCPPRVNGTRGSCRAAARRGLARSWRGGPGRAEPRRAGPPPPPAGPRPAPPPPAAAGGAMRPAPLLGLLLWAPLLWPPPVRGLRHPVHWNGSNPRFLRDDYTIQVAINDYLDIYCPHYEGAVPAGRAETFTLFMVDREGYRGCYQSPGAFKRWECNRPLAPFRPDRFSEKIQRFTPFSLGFEFQPGETYYYISVPSPESAGRCLKLRVSVCCRGTTPEPATEVPNSQPRGRGGAEDAVSAQGITAPLQPRAPCLVLALLALLWI